MNKIKIYEKGDKNQMYQGDMSILKINEASLPDTLRFKSLKSKAVVGHSETGHHHVVVAEREALVEIAQDDKGFYLKINKGNVNVVHEKTNGHETQTIKRGIFFIGKQYEYDEREDRPVMD